MNTASSLDLFLLAVALNPELHDFFGSFFASGKTVHLEHDLEKMIERPTSETPTMIVVGHPQSEVSPIEFAQLLRMHYPETPILFVTTRREGFDKKVLLKNGFSDIYLFPMERTTLETRLKDEISLASQGKIKSFKPVRILDLTPGTVFPNIKSTQSTSKKVRCTSFTNFPHNNCGRWDRPP
jgi:DNA-binding response OmpR family regulator